MFSLLCHFQHHGGLWISLSVLSALIFIFFFLLLLPPSIFSAAPLEAEWCLQSGQHAKQRGEVLPIQEPRVETRLRSGVRGGGGRGGGRGGCNFGGWELRVKVMVMSLPACAQE